MVRLPQDELRQIKWILAGILGCTVVIALTLAPGLIHLALILIVVYALGLAVWTLSESVRSLVTGLWLDVSNLWRR